MITLPPPPSSALLERFDAALDAERGALLSGEEQRLAQATRAKAALVEALVAEGRAGSQAGPAIQRRLRELADKNRINGLLIAERISDVQGRRQFFERIAGRDSVYGRDGVTLPTSTPRWSARI